MQPDNTPITSTSEQLVDSSQPGNFRGVWLCGLALVVSLGAAVAAHSLLILIGVITNLSFYGRIDTTLTSPVTHGLGGWVVVVPVAGSVLIALLARWGTRSILGHGIPEVMEQVLVNRSRISPQVALLKPIGSAISIGTGGPYGAEGPVIATGSALGSLIGQVLTLTAIERRVLLSSGAAAAMTMVFGSPVAATLLTVELLLFEFKARSLVPVMLAASLAQAVRYAWTGGGAVFPLGAALELDWQLWPSIGFIGLVAGIVAVSATAAAHGMEKLFSHFIRSWMLRPVLGGAAVGLIGLWQPHVFGASYDVIKDLLRGDAPVAVMLIICGCKLAAWVISLSSGTSGGTLAPMLIAGGGVGLLATMIAGAIGLPTVPPALAALTGMIAFFAGGTHAYIASVILGVEIHR
ncbi:chloride channel protein [Actomonas aquatica]|uniref:Chloride channel protein n=1 Tax=Actomonas aquatica TaxID=2866162 RepID=A0ABZ1C4E4_9BACT|nr:chloride channel protein [Opitutus sp. WL0086]WRQ86579.1 chloride channel protein [Opitutus sp. WL0086]